MSDGIVAEWAGHCPICDTGTMFRAYGTWFRDQLICINCAGYSVPRERALMLMLRRLCPNWRKLRIHESSPANRGVSDLLTRQCSGYVPTQLFPDVQLGESRNGMRCENLEAMTFPNQSFDVVITQDVMEHVFYPCRAYREVWRTLKPGGLYLHTTPIYSGMAESVRAAELDDDGEVRHLMPPEYHGNPIDDAGSLVTFRFGRDLADKIAFWAPFSVEVTCFHDRQHGILGEFTEVIACTRYRTDSDTTGAEAQATVQGAEVPRQADGARQARGLLARLRAVLRGE